MKKIINMFFLVISFIFYAFLIFASCCTAEKLNGIVNSFSLWIYAFWQVGVIPVCLVYQLLYFSKKSKSEVSSNAMRLISFFVVVAFIATKILF